MGFRPFSPKLYFELPSLVTSKTRLKQEVEFTLGGANRSTFQFVSDFSRLFVRRVHDSVQFFCILCVKEPRMVNVTTANRNSGYTIPAEKLTSTLVLADGIQSFLV